MGSTGTKKNRMLEIFFRAMKGENISVKSMADEYGVSCKSISRDLGEIKNFLCENRELTGNTELKYAANSKTYYLEFDNFLLSKELISIIKMMIGCRAFSKMEILEIISKLKNFTSFHDRSMLEKIIMKEMYHYNEVKHDCESVIDTLWQLTRCIYEKIEITVSYYKMNRQMVERRLIPAAITFSDYYFYLIAYRCDEDDWKPLYYRVDRIVNVVEHRKHFEMDREHDFDEGELRSKIQFMLPGEYRKIRFAYTGNSVQAILDKIPTAKIVDKIEGGAVIEAEVFGAGVNMFLLSQGKTVKALYPESFVNEMKEEIEKMFSLYK
ncbi:MAG: WYL domain-containing protein [Lachnospiraceae bacterium]|nr:WYL domain-containing protein [Lachnospiraceae bacterium]MCI9676355.1 WYL domain-containing protein [Lachnospiraceae bacterium]